MLSVQDAFELIVNSVKPLAVEPCSTLKAAGRTLAEAVCSPVAVPPFDKSIMDGFAVREVETGAQTPVIETVTAGETPHLELRPGQATHVMTGAPVPSGCDCVIKIEDCEFDATNGVVVCRAAGPAGQNVLKRAALIDVGDPVLQAGQRLTAAQLALLVELGIETVSVYARPTVAVLATGNELVSLGEGCGPGQIRNSNEPMLLAQIAESGAEAVGLGIARDDPAHLKQKVSQALESDAVVLSGGVSMGELDLVPKVLAELDVKQVFHKARLKPGKPIWFGTGPNGQAVFGLPGNPVSSLVCSLLFVATALRRMQGMEDASPRTVSASLSADHLARGDRETYYPAVLSTAGDAFSVQPLAWKGSADLKTVAAANAFAVFPAGDRQFRAGEQIEVLPMRDDSAFRSL